MEKLQKESSGSSSSFNLGDLETKKVVSSIQESQDDESIQSTQKGDFKRTLTARHLQFLSMGANVGTGLFIGTSTQLTEGGSLAMILGFIFVNFIVASMLMSLTELTIMFPIHGSYIAYPAKFIDPAITFAFGYQLWVVCILVFAIEGTTFCLLIEYWTVAIPKPASMAIFVLATLSLHIFPVSFFGKAETATAILKLATLIGFFIFAITYLAGGTPVQQEDFTSFDSGNLFTNGFFGLVSVFVLGAFASGGTEIIGMAGAETVNPRFNVPRAAKSTVARMFFIYVCVIVVLACSLSPSSPALHQEKEAESSPFVIICKQAGVPVLANIVNAIILICVASVGNCYAFSGARILSFLASKNMGLKYFDKVDKKGRPITALITTAIPCIALAFITTIGSTKVVFDWLSRVIGLTIILIWFMVFIANARLRQIIKAQNDTAFTEPYGFWHKWFAPVNYIGMVCVILLIICQLLNTIHPVHGKASVSLFFSNFLGILVFIVSYIGYKIYHKDYKLLIPLEEVDIKTGRYYPHLDDESISQIEDYYSKSLLKRIWTYATFQ
ncbi:hypothetical protein CANCADRAFT_23870 [Tortispora caseinolytica NRRL Y-17796]|uniref:Amino acid permease/ SLC12A domain-containing protein n=1 Tax=Tortispora caseinolytica NRRL Y-17796 TaxID=767744 RepID=A0A1E4TDZ7_9ASCO|nr:hypothetical protein CANCADRAFT_23870 [Tortispora caseinolytica NRRL Y-17796]